MESGLRAELMGEVDEVWSETLRHLPLSSGQQDPTREKVEFVAVVRTGDREAERVSFGRGSTSRSSIMAAGGYLRIDRLAYPDLQLRKGDKLVALERENEPAFEVLSVDDRSHLRLICELGDA
ncbi:hypothetical protein [Aliiroseovarius lamellibrachiae]|uniref:hypothetical protein n=1 Tax=Aliiroseovarius lamellibrachiae TaxID=1924933 RepID=UPI001BE0DB3B|nr:hypothetical protein [Aliiroseovarius lamellibrachiae]MBT2130118.1 hypothetical protein [Aliiroseovarius lamellibrachiae]